ncbi:MAG: gephyrin-like molybdotransferase Glp [Peptococcales bacterium]|jgi:molybdopterin molybdotransferase
MNFKVYELENAQQLLLNKIKVKEEVVHLGSAWGKVLAEEITAPINVPQFRKSALDGFALRAADTFGAEENNPKKIKIIDEIQAGDTRILATLLPGCGVKILTGAPLPSGADVVIRKEDFDQIDGEITIFKELIKDSNIIDIGDDIKIGETLFSSGELLTPYHVGVLASLGISHVKIYKPPQVALLSTGTELKNPGELLEFGQIYNSNLYTLSALVKSLGGSIDSLGNIPDKIEIIKVNLYEALDKCDLVLTTGGASVGDYDLIEEALQEMGAEILFNRIKIKPGSPVVAGLIKGKLVIGLSGNPAACLITFELLVRPLIKKLMGKKDVEFRYNEVILVDGFQKASFQRRFVRVNVKYKNGKWLAYQTGKQSTGILKSMVNCNALIDIPAGSEPIKPGSLVKAILLKDDLSYF